MSEQRMFWRDCAVSTGSMHGSRKFCQSGSSSYSSFLMRGKRIQIALKAGHHRPGSETPFIRGSRKFCQRESKSDKVFFWVFKGSEAPKNIKSGQLSACQRNAIEMAFRWWVDDAPTLNATLLAL